MSETISDEEVVIRFAGHPVDRDTIAHYRGLLEGELRINRCGDCGAWHHPPKPVCPSCWSTNVVATPVSGDGTIDLTMFLHQGPPIEGVDYSGGYPVVTVELDEQPGLRYTSTVIGAQKPDITIGRRVTLDWIERGGVPLAVFRLAGDGEARRAQA